MNRVKGSHGCGLEIVLAWCREPVSRLCGAGQDETGRGGVELGGASPGRPHSGRQLLAFLYSNEGVLGEFYFKCFRLYL